jgi:hypothetical protein
LLRDQKTIINYGESMEDKWNKEIRHQVDVITDSDWFMELVEEKVKKVIEKMEVIK